MALVIGGDRFLVESTPIEVTSLSRPDSSWSHVDAHGHKHQWHVDLTPKGTLPAAHYDPRRRYSLPTLRRVVTTQGGDDYPDIYHYECLECGDHVEPGSRPDDTSQYITGFQRYYINDEPVSREYFEQRLRDAQK